MPLSRSRVGWMLGLVAGLAVAGSPTWAQFGRDKDKNNKRPPTQPAATTPANPQAARQPGQPSKLTEKIAPKVLQLVQSRDWTLNIDLRITAGWDYKVVDKALFPDPKKFAFKTGAFVFPILRSSATHRIELDAQNKERVTAQLFWNDRLYDAEPTFQEGYQSGARLARWEVRDVEGSQARIKIEKLLTSWNSVYDEDLAMTVPWPASWPAVPASSLQRQLFVESDAPEIKELVNQWTEGKDPKSIPPAQLAKVLTGKVLEYAQPSGNGLVFTKAGELMGFDLRGALGVARDARGSTHDIACFHAAIFRAAGLPARTVIGYDQSEKDSGKGFGGKGNSKSAGGLRSWIEFAMVDPFDGKEFWVPVDVNRMRRSGSKAQALNRPWKYFGTHDEMAFLIPIAFQYHPPTSVSATAPAFWGWLTTPQAVAQEQALTFRVIRTPQRGGEPNRRDKKREE